MTENLKEGSDIAVRDLRDFEILVLPGWHNSGPGHWQSEWLGFFPNMRRVEQEDWETPCYADWGKKLSAEVAGCRKPILFVAHSLGTSLVMRWAHENDARGIAGAFLVAASDRDRFDNELNAPIQGFAPMIAAPLPFPSMLLASRNDHRVSFDRAKFFANAWGSIFVDAGPLGHMSTELGLWPQGLVWLGQFVGTLSEISN